MKIIRNAPEVFTHLMVPCGMNTAMHTEKHTEKHTEMSFEDPKPKKKKTLWVVLLLLLALLLLAGWFLWRESQKQAEGLRNQTLLLVGLEVAYCQYGSVQKPAEECTGQDQRMVSGGHTDTLMLLTTRPNGSLRVVSVPRDTRVPGTTRRINTSYLLGGVELLKKDLQNLTGLSIQNHMLIDTRMAAQVIDTVGGLDVEVKPPGMQWMDRAAGVDFQLSPGKHHLNGKQAVLYLRVRKGAGDDYGRTTRQREAIAQLSSKIKQPASLLKLSVALPGLLKQMDSSMGFNNMLGYLPYAQQGSFESVMLPIREVPGSTLLEVDKNAWNQTRYPALPEGTRLQLSVINHSSHAGLARKLGQFLSQRGVTVTRVDNGAPLQQTTLEGPSGQTRPLQGYLQGTMQVGDALVVHIGEDFPQQNPELYQTLQAL